MFEQFLEAARIFDVAVLGFASVLVVALVPDVLSLRLAAWRRRRKSRPLLKNLQRQLENGRFENTPLLRKLKVMKDPVCRFYEAGLSCEEIHDPALLSQRLATQADGGRLRLANTLKGVGPLAGMAGSVLGLMTYSIQSSNQSEMAEALGFLLTTTLVGTFVAVGAWFVSFQIESLKEQIYVACSEAEEVLCLYRNRLASAAAAEVESWNRGDSARCILVRNARTLRKEQRPRESAKAGHDYNASGTDLSPSKPVKEKGQHVHERKISIPGNGKRIRVF